MNNYYDQSQLFKFNLIPPKTKEELLVLEERDNSTLYSFLLVFVGMLIFFILTLVQSLFITPRVNSGEITIKNKDEQIAGYSTVKKMKGELFVKAQSLEPILDKDIKTSEVLTVGKNVLDKVSQSSITNYTREITGDFVIEFTISKVDDAVALLTNLKQQDKITNVFLRTITVNEKKNNVQTVVSFTLKN